MAADLTDILTIKKIDTNEWVIVGKINDVA